MKALSWITAKHISITYIGFAIGGINTIFLFTNILSGEQYGSLAYLYALSNILFPIIAVGTPTAIIRFFPRYENLKKTTELLVWLLIIPLIITLGLSILIYWKYSLIQRIYNQKSLQQQYIWMAWIFAVCMTFFDIGYAIAKSQLKTIFGNFLKEISVRLYTSITLILLYYNLISFKDFMILISIAYLLRTIVMLFYAIKQYPIGIEDIKIEKLKKISLKIPREILAFLIPIAIRGIIFTVLIDIDKTMIERYLTVPWVARYQICAYIAVLIEVPSRALLQVLFPVTSRLMYKNNKISKQKLQKLFDKSSYILSFLSGWIFLLIVANAQDFFNLPWIPNSYEAQIGVIIAIGTAKLCESFLGNSNAILFTSKYYNLFIIIGIVGMLIAVGLNIWWIPRFGILGAAWATCATSILLSATKLYIIQKKIGFQTVDPSKIRLFSIIMGYCSLALQFQLEFGAITNIIIKTLLISISYIPLGIYFNWNLFKNTYEHYRHLRAFRIFDKYF